MRKQIKIKVFILLLISVLFIWGNQLDDALNLIEENEHGKARNLLNDFISNNTNSGRLVEAYIGLYKTFTWKYSFDNKIILADSISSMFPFKKHTNIMRIETANYFITQSEYFEASKWLMEIIMFTNKNNSNYNTAINRVKRYINSYLEPAQIEYMLYNYSVETLFPLMLFRLYAINFENSEFEKAEYFRQKLIIEHPESFYTREYILEMESATETGIKIAILLPTTGEFAPFGESVRKGIVIAKDEDDIDYVVFNTFSNPIRTAKIIDSIYKDKSFIAVIGPVSSMETTAAGAYLFDGKVLPILVPVATNGELMNFGKNIFLINKTLIEQARFTADYVANDDNIKSVGIIFPDDSYGRTLATAFSDEALKKGVNIPFEISYIPGT
ncbi:amino acid ABC transporter substrate-binding protein, partial [candidate division WOR-3 bacterium]|nr:amino acid ABC transporter substrate-binding protein [candidate division WOR-3 bacterium]